MDRIRNPIQGLVGKIANDLNALIVIFDFCLPVVNDRRGEVKSEKRNQLRTKPSGGTVLLKMLARGGYSRPIRLFLDVRLLPLNWETYWRLL